MLGSDTREKGRVTGFATGLKQAGLGLGYGVWDGLAGLVTEPIVGARRSGVKGAAQGAGKSCELLAATLAKYGSDDSGQSGDAPSVGCARAGGPPRAGND